MECLRIAIYSRKSEITGQGDSIANQIDMCRDYIHSRIEGGRDSEILVYEDEGFSGKNMERPQFKQMMRDAGQKGLDYIICYRLDRISRNISDFASLIEDLQQKDISFVSIREQFDTSTPMGRAMMFIASVFAQLERETIAQRVRDNMMMLAKTGRWLGGTTPTGYRSEKMENVIIDGKITSFCKLIFEPEEIETVKIIFDQFLLLRSISGVSKFLIAQGLNSRHKKYFSLQGIREILQNPVYANATKEIRDYFLIRGAEVCFSENDCTDKYGLIAYNKRDYTKKHAPRQAETEWIIAKGKHKGILDGASWIRVQEILEENKPKGENRVKMHNDYSLLSGMIFCKSCGNRMFAKFRHNRGRDMFDYICNNKMRGGMKLCNCQNLNGLETDDMVCSYLKDYMKQDSSIFAALERLKGKVETEAVSDPLKAVEKNIDKLKTEMNNYIQTLGKSGVSDALLASVNQTVEEIDGKLKVLYRKQAILQQNAEVVRGATLGIDVITKTLAHFKDHFQSLNLQDKRDLIRLIIEKFEWDGENFTILLYGK